MLTVEAKPTSARSKRRVLPPEVRRAQLIQATMACIAENGLAGTTMATVTRKAGLSLGIANLYFQTKEKMLIETLRYVTDEFTDGQQAELNNKKYDTVAKKIQAILKFDLSPKVTEKSKLAVWVAFWGEAKSRPTYQRIRAQADIQIENIYRDLFQSAVDEAGYKNTDADLIARGYTALVDGLWLDLLVSPRQFNRKKARQITNHYLATAFPEHVPRQA
jgi:TetR/AcrR family transcriptional regulator, transcriptional repressor of bet genes